MQNLGRAQVVAPELLNAMSLAAAVDRAVATALPRRAEIDCDGAGRSAKIVTALLARAG